MCLLMMLRKGRTTSKTMKKLHSFLFILILLPTLIHGSENTERKPWIVYMGDLRGDGASLSDLHHNMLLAAIGDEKLARESKIHTYEKSLNAFAARLLPHEADKLKDHDGVVSVFPSKKRKLRTTRSWDFVGLTENAKRQAVIESDIVVGLLDTGVWMGAPSFNDAGFGPPPPKWKAKCHKGGNFTGCNNKVIGAKYFDLDKIDPNPSPADSDGHGSHTASTAAGAIVKGASLYGIAKGTARGGVPAARIASYKVCWTFSCTDMDLLAGFDEAISDGVDLISISIGGPSMNFFDDSIAIGAFHAMKKGILTSCSAGNDGPIASTVENVAPWIMTVAATSLDRQFAARVTLGNGVETPGMAINTFSPKKKMYPLTSGTKASNVTRDEYGSPSACDYGTLNVNKVKGKIVYCQGVTVPEYNIRDLRGAGVIMKLDAKQDYTFPIVIPGTYVAPNDGDQIDRYINSTKNPQAVVHKTKSVKITAPFVASFSSRGPQAITKNILKPDIAAPGIDILAGYSHLTTVTDDPDDKRHVVFNIISGTSMACPHAAAAAAYVKSFHPAWSPAAIKSALMTTATPMKIKEKDAELGSGSGQINPIGALHPGLVYDLSMSSYISFLCKEGYNSTTIGLLLGGKKKIKCSDFKPAAGTDGLNYPNMHTQLSKSTSKISAVFYRTVTNVGYGRSVYKAIVKSPKGLSIAVTPNTLEFDKPYLKKSFKVVVKGLMPSKTEVLSVLLEWTDSKHSVNSHILIYRGLS